MKLYTENINIPQKSEHDIQKILDSLQEKRENLGFIDVEKYVDIQKIETYVKKIGNDFDSIVVLGVGGSALGTKALLEMMYGKYYNEILNKKGRNIYVLDNIDADSIGDICEIIDINKTLFCVISKSGGTIETLSEYLFFKEQVQEIKTSWKQNFCFIVGENCKMKDVLEKDFEVFYIPENIGGRFSVFTAVGLLPIAFSGANISEFITGVISSKDIFLSGNLEENIPLKLALIQHYFYEEKNKNITVFFPYSSRMFQLGEWYKQLMGESIGKNGKGVTLTSSLGITDQHSQVQLYQDGPRDKFFIFLDIKNIKQDYKISKNWDISFQKLCDMEKYGTQSSLESESIATSSLKIDSINERNIGKLLYMFQMQIAYLGELFEVNAFDQPGVEKGKIITRKQIQENFGDIDMFNTAFYE